MHITHLKSALEAILFLQHKPITLNRLRDLIDETLEADTYKQAIAELMEAYAESGHGIEIAEISNGYVFRTKLEHRDMIRRMNEVTPVKMSQAMLEVLSITAFNQPVTREKIEDIRGVECGHHLRNLMEKKLVRIVGRSDAVGRPILYGTTREFLELFGMDTLKDLPALRDIEEMLPQNEVGAHEDEENRVRGELQDIVADSKPLEFSDLETAELKFFDELDEKAKAKKNAASQKHAEEKAGPHGQEEQTETEAFTNSNGSKAQDLHAAQNGEAEGAKDLADEVAGPVSFGSVIDEQKREWPLDEKIEEENELDAEELKEISSAFNRECRPPEITEDPSGDGN